MTNPGEGERLEAARRRRFWLTLAIITFGGAIVGLFAGSAAAHRDLNFNEVWASFPPTVVIGVIGVSMLAFFYGTWRFFKVIDEVELVDNLWASTATCYAYMVLFPLWWVLDKAGIVGEPNDWAIFYTALAAGGVLYLARKWRAR